MKFPCKKGQYFSFDAIVASIIFALAISILSTHWFALRAQIDDHDNYLQQEAYRISDVLLSAGDPPAWYVSPLSATRAGLLVDSHEMNMLNLTTLAGTGTQQINADAGASCNDPSGRYALYQSLLSTGSDFWVEANLSTVDGKPITIQSNYWFGCAPSSINSSIQIVQVRRIVSVRQDAPTPTPPRYYWGNLTVYLWNKKTMS